MPHGRLFFIFVGVFFSPNRLIAYCAESIDAVDLFCGYEDTSTDKWEIRQTTIAWPVCICTVRLNQRAGDFEKTTESVQILVGERKNISSAMGFPSELSPNGHLSFMQCGGSSHSLRPCLGIGFHFHHREVRKENIIPCSMEKFGSSGSESRWSGLNYSLNELFFRSTSTRLSWNQVISITSFPSQVIFITYFQVL